MNLTRKPVKIRLIDNDKVLFMELKREGYELSKVYDAYEEFNCGISKGTYQLENGIAWEGYTAVKITK